MHGSHLDSLRGLGKHRQHDDSSDSSEQQNENYSARLVFNNTFVSLNFVVATCSKCHAEIVL